MARSNPISLSSRNQYWIYRKTQTQSKRFYTMALHYTNPNDWGKSPLTDFALQMQQFRAENPEVWNRMINDDLISLLEHKRNSDPSVADEEETPYPPFTGTEYVATHETIDDHPYSVAFGQFLGNGIEPDTANELAFGEHSAISKISNDPNDDTRVRAVNIFDRLNDMGYWRESGERDKEPESFSFE